MNSRKPSLRKPMPWGNLVWFLPLAYVFWHPYEQQADWMEWFVTGLTLAAVLVLFLLGQMYQDERRIVRAISIALLGLAMAFLAYRPSGGIYFPVVAVFVPAVGGSAALRVASIAGLTIVFGLEWWLLNRDHTTISILFPAAITAQIMLVGLGMIFMQRHTRETQRFHKAAERERIARDLHDLLGHTLSSIALKAELARRVLDIDPQRASKEIGDVERIAREGLEDVRQAIHGYHAGDIYAEVDRAESILKAANLRVERCCEKLEMDPVQEQVLALVLREAATNILRHASARTCRLALFREDGEYRLEISDDGRGGRHEEGLGMRSIRTRIEALGGRAVWHSVLGTQLLVSLPISAGEKRS